MKDTRSESGFALITILVLLALLMALLLTHFSVTWIEMSTTRSSMKSFKGFYAAEAGLNLRADLVRQGFVGFAVPSGTSPDTSGSNVACAGSNVGSGDFACSSYTFADRKVVTWVEEQPNSNNPIVVPRGENYRNLHGHEVHYVVYSRAIASNGLPEAVLEMHFKSRSVPLFQFAAFYGKDLEILPSSSLYLEGPVHTQGDLYVGSGGTLDITEQVTTIGSVFHGRKDADSCLAGGAAVADPDSQEALPNCSSNRVTVTDTSTWNGMIAKGLTPLTVPAATTLDPTAGSPYWDRADLRIVLDINGTPALEVRDADDSVNVGLTTHLSSCAVVSASSSLYDNREASTIEMLEIDTQGLLNCVHTSSLSLDDTTDGGLVWYFTVDGPSSSVVNNYGVRIQNGAELVSTIPGAPAVQGLTIVSDQALFIQGDHNSTNKLPSGFVADSINVLSGAWSDAGSVLAVASRPAADTTINAAFLSGTDSTGAAEGAGGRDSGSYNGGLDNLLRLHEDWTGDTLTVMGSFVSLDNSRHDSGTWAAGDPYYIAPTRDWTFDLDFEDPLLIPPLAPRSVYLRQELFVRRFEI